MAAISVILLFLWWECLGVEWPEEAAVIQASGSVDLEAMSGGYRVLSTEGLEYEDPVKALEESES